MKAQWVIAHGGRKWHLVPASDNKRQPALCGWAPAGMWLGMNGSQRRGFCEACSLAQYREVRRKARKVRK